LVAQLFIIQEGGFPEYYLSVEDHPCVPTLSLAGQVSNPSYDWQTEKAPHGASQFNNHYI
ncbi:hypothetical protein AB4Z22_30210, partial [Paenibacillus sp. TAF58]